MADAMPLFWPWQMVKPMLTVVGDCGRCCNILCQGCCSCNLYVYWEYSPESPSTSRVLAHCYQLDIYYWNYKIPGSARTCTLAMFILSAGRSHRKSSCNMFYPRFRCEWFFFSLALMLDRTSFYLCSRWYLPVFFWGMDQYCLWK